MNTKPAVYYKYRQPVFLCALVLSVLVAAFVFIATLYVLYASHWHGPFRDMWEIYPFLEKIINHSWQWKDLWEPYGYSHRLVVPQLLFVADYQFFNANNHLLIAISLFCQLAVVFLLARTVCRNNNFSLLNKVFLVSAIVILLFSGSLLFNLMHTFDVQWFLVTIFITGSFYILTQSRILGILEIAISVLLIAAACWCNFSAMAAWPIWFVLAFYQRRPIKFLWPLLLLVLTFIWVSAGHPQSHIDDSSILNVVIWFLYITIFFPLFYLSNPMSDPDYSPIGFFGVMLAVFALFFLFRFWWGYLFKQLIEENKDRDKLFFSCLALFCFGVALMTGIGRGYDPSHVQALRYQNIVVLFWSAVIPLIILELQSFTLTIRRIVYISLALVVVLFVWCQPKMWSKNLLLGRNVARSHLALMMGYSHDVPMIAATLSRSMIYVPQYNLEKERLLHEQSKTGIYYGIVADAWMEGVDLSNIQKSCPKLKWSLKLKNTPYTSFISFTVSGDLASDDYSYDYALLVNPAGKVLAVAERDRSRSLIDELNSILGNRKGRLKGFSQVAESDQAVLVLGNKRDTIEPCKL